MTPKEKAEELFFKFNKKGLYQISSIIYRVIRKKMIIQCALIAVDEIIKETKLHDKTIYQHTRTFYWQEVKQEIEKL